MSSIPLAIRRRSAGRRWRWLRAAMRRWSPPYRRREFWATQVLVFAIAGGHAALEASQWQEATEHLNLVPVSLFLIPVVYAGLNFGLRGAAPTAIWCALLTIPNILLWHSGTFRFAELWQAGLVVAVGLLVGQRIDREQRARAQAVRRERARRASESKYRSLFETTADPILLIRPDGVVEEGNAAAAALFGLRADELYGRALEALGGRELAAMVRDGAPFGVVRLVDRARGDVRWFEPVAPTFGSGPARIQLVLRDVTAQQERQEGLEAYTRQTLAAREEEGRRIARDLHDGPVQELVVLWRKLDELAEGVTGERRTQLGEARAMAEQVANDLRRVSRDLRPSLLDDLGLGPALKAEVAAFAARSGVDARYVQTGAPRRLGSEVELMLLRIVQEAVHNIERHAHARKAVVRLALQASSVRLTVTDDGQGFDATVDSRSLLEDGRLGLIGMRERARLIGARLTIRSGRAGRTSVSVVAPAR